MEELQLRGKSSQTIYGKVHFAQPAMLDDATVHELIREMPEWVRPFLRKLLIDGRNEPWRGYEEQKQCQINAKLRTMRIGNKRYYLPCRKLTYQLWELC